MIHEGKILKSAVKLNDLSAEMLAAKAEMSKTQLYRLFKKEVIDDYNKKCLLKAGLNVNELARTEQTIPNLTGHKMYVDDLVPAIMMLRDQYKLLQDEYKFLCEETKLMKEKMLEVLKKEAKNQKTPQSK